MKLNFKKSFLRIDENTLINFRYDAVSAMRAMEKFTQEVGGYPFLYADIFMTRKEFEEMFDLTGKKSKKYIINIINTAKKIFFLKL